MSLNYSPDRGEVMCYVCRRETATHEWENDYGMMHGCTDCYMDQFDLAEGEFDDEE